MGFAMHRGGGFGARGFDQAENRLHAQKALLASLLNEDFSREALRPNNE